MEKSQFLGDLDRLAVEPRDAMIAGVDGDQWLTAFNATVNGLVYCYDLMVDPADLRDLSDDDLAKRLAKRPTPLRWVKVNQAPTLIPLSVAPERIEPASGKPGAVQSTFIRMVGGDFFGGSRVSAGRF